MPPRPYPPTDDESSDDIGNYMSEEESEDEGIYDADSDEEEDKMVIDLKRTDSKKMSKNYNYEVVPFDKLNSVYFGKLIALRSNFEYANLHDTILVKIFEENKFIYSKAQRALNDRIFDYMEKYKIVAVDLKNGEELMCNICCMEIESISQAQHFGCGHVFCSLCMADYVEYRVSQGPDCLSTPCPYSGCPFKLSHEVVDSCCSEQTKGKYNKFVLDHYVDLAPYLSFCKSPDCQMALMADETSLSYNGNLAQMNASCDCGTVVCMRCKGLGHEPLSCEMYKEWEDSISIIYDKLNYLWKKGNTKKCPGCNCDIEKNQGCNFMKCSKCQQQFCWFCLKDWKQHNQKHVWKNECNKFENKKSVDEMNEEEKLKRMEFYMDRFRGHKLSYELNDDRIKAHIKRVRDRNDTLCKINTKVSPSTPSHPSR